MTAKQYIWLAIGIICLTYGAPHYANGLTLLGVIITGFTLFRVYKTLFFIN